MNLLNASKSIFFRWSAGPYLFFYYGDDPVDHGDVHNNKGEMILCVIFHPWDNEIILGE